MKLAVNPPVEPMLARGEPAIPVGDGWRYEPKWDGFRALIFRDGDELHIGSRNALPLERYFPELLDPLRAALPERCAMDGEIVIATESGLNFDLLQLRLHPAASRVAKLAAATPATAVIFDVLCIGDDDVRGLPLDERRPRLVEAVRPGEYVATTPHTSDADEAAVWFAAYEGAGLDGLVAKRNDQPYLAGERGWVKVKHLRTVDCVVGGYRLDKPGTGIGSLLLGLFNDEGVFHHVGHTSSFSAKERRELLGELQSLRTSADGESFGKGRTPGGPSRWSAGKDLSWFPLRPERVCEVSFDHLQGDRFRHASRFLRWRTDKDPSDCTFDQIARPAEFDLKTVLAQD